MVMKLKPVPIRGRDLLVVKNPISLGNVNALLDFILENEDLVEFRFLKDRISTLTFFEATTDETLKSLE